MQRLKPIQLLLLILIAANSFSQEPNFALIGYATVPDDIYNTTTGGEGGDTIVISTFSELETYAKSREKNTTPEILIISGYIEANPTTVITFKHGANLTILGANEGAELNGVGIRIWDYNNTIIRNLKIHEIFYPDDALSIEECQHVWVDHNELHSKIGAGIGVDTYDGLLDIKKGSSYVTVSWNYLHDHMKCMLIGHTDNATQGVEDQAMRITIHHNIFERTNGRNPSLRWGAAHIFNNLYADIDDYAIALRQGAHGMIENNSFYNVKTCISTNKFDGEGFACLSGNIYSGSTTESSNSISQTNCDFWNDLPYEYELDSAENLESTLRGYAGIGKISTVTITQDTTETNGINDFRYTELKCYPNPANQQLNVAFHYNEYHRITLTIKNVSGQTILRKSFSTKAGNNLIQVDTEMLNSGIYLLNIENSGIRKLIIKE